jgi:hypothetical protein
VDLVRFARELRTLDAHDISVIAADLTELVSSPADEVAVTKARLAIEQSLVRLHRSSQAGLASYAVAQAVLASAERAGMALPDANVTRVARSAATIARGCIAGFVVEDAVQFLAGGWRHVLGVRAAA